MITGARRGGREDAPVIKICCAPEPSEKPCADPERVQRWRTSLASLLFFTVLLCDHLWLCAGAKLRSRERLHRRAHVREHDCGVFLNLTDPECADTDAHGREPLESACSTLYRQRSASVSSSYSVPVATVSPHAFLEFFRNFSLSFCDSFTVADLLEGMASPDGLNCSLAHVIRDLFSGGPQDGDVCSACIHAYVRLDQHAQEKYQEFDSLTRKYMADDYSVRAHTQLCQVMYKAWLCVEYFPVVPHTCVRWVSCKQYCREVVANCPYILPDNNHLVYGGLPSFICTGLLEDEVTNQGPDCCDVRWSGCGSAVGAACALTRLPVSLSWQRRSSSEAVSCACRLYGNRLKLCVLALFLLHTVVSITTLQPSSTASLDAMVTLEEGPTREE
ncbi:NALCN channel auxiliary factor 2 isoform X2 [Brachyhypopomus gauderio]|uniref:NALCN channel auxiliary factor 2 isoform X2 n=1 Tax=Brachyhypopomus gauderio TaxID=698409 RepID=UPI0040411234